MVETRTSRGNSASPAKASTSTSTSTSKPSTSAATSKSSRDLEKPKTVTPSKPQEQEDDTANSTTTSTIYDLATSAYFEETLREHVHSHTNKLRFNDDPNGTVRATQAAMHFAEIPYKQIMNLEGMPEPRTFNPPDGESVDAFEVRVNTLMKALNGEVFNKTPPNDWAGWYYANFDMVPGRPVFNFAFDSEPYIAALLVNLIQDVNLLQEYAMPIFLNDVPPGATSYAVDAHSPELKNISMMEVQDRMMACLGRGRLEGQMLQCSTRGFMMFNVTSEYIQPVSRLLQRGRSGRCYMGDNNETIMESKVDANFALCLTRRTTKLPENVGYRMAFCSLHRLSRMADETDSYVVGDPLIYYASFHSFTGRDYLLITEKKVNVVHHMDSYVPTLGEQLLAERLVKRPRGRPRKNRDESPVDRDQLFTLPKKPKRESDRAIGRQTVRLPVNDQQDEDFVIDDETVTACYPLMGDDGHVNVDNDDDEESNISAPPQRTPTASRSAAGGSGTERTGHDRFSHFSKDELERFILERKALVVDEQLSQLQSFRGTVTRAENMMDRMEDFLAQWQNAQPAESTAQPKAENVLDV